jgi:hypothetical protein
MYKVKSIDELVLTLQNGDSATFNETHFLLSGNSLDVTAWSSYMHIENITKQTSEKELIELKFYVKGLCEDHSKLNEFLITKHISYSLCYDSGKAGITICKENNNQITWFI